jgi:hypothetical protein
LTTTGNPSYLAKLAQTVERAVYLTNAGSCVPSNRFYFWPSTIVANVIGYGDKHKQIIACGF